MRPPSKPLLALLVALSIIAAALAAAVSTPAAAAATAGASDLVDAGRQCPGSAAAASPPSRRHVASFVAPFGHVPRRPSSGLKQEDQAAAPTSSSSSSSSSSARTRRSASSSTSDGGQGDKPAERRTCRICHQSYDPKENHDGACRYHPGDYLGNEASKFYGTRSGGENTGLARFWDCCEATDPMAPGCTPCRHRGYDE